MGDADDDQTLPIFKPLKPKMGNIVQISKSTWAAFTTGIPNEDWSGLEAAQDPERPLNPMQVCHVDDSTGYADRCSALNGKNKQTRIADRAKFCRQLLERFKECGTDAVTYILSSRDNKIVCILTEFPCFTEASMATMMEIQKTAYETYDQTNDTSNIKALLASLEKGLWVQVKNEIKPSFAFNEVLMSFLQIVQSGSLEHFQKLRAHLKHRVPSGYTAQNIDDMANDQLADACELTAGGAYEHFSRLHMIDGFLLANGGKNYEHVLRSTRMPIKQAIDSIGLLLPSEQDDALKKLKYTFEHICKTAKDIYREELEHGRWPPALHAKDSKQPL